MFTMFTPISLFRPAKDINYNFITAAYGVGTFLGVFLYSLQRILHAPEDVGTNAGNVDIIASSESIKEFSQSLQGLYLIFVPFFPCFIWSLWMRRNWLCKELDIDEHKKKD